MEGFGGPMAAVLFLAIEHWHSCHLHKMEGQTLKHLVSGFAGFFTRAVIDLS